MNKIDNYIFNPNLHKYGNNQSYYQDAVSLIISNSHKRLTDSVAQGNDLTELFFEFLKTFSIERNKIALATRTEEAPSFGLRRDSEKAITDVGHVAYTTLSGTYLMYGKKMASMIEDMVASQGKFDSLPSAKTLCEKTAALGLTSAFELKIYGKELIEGGWLSPPILDQALEDVRGKQLSCYEKLKHIEQNYPELYLRDKMLYRLTQVSNMLEYERTNRLSPDPIKTFLSEKDHYFAQTSVKVEISGKMVALSTYITQIKVKKPEEDVEVNQRGMLIHHDICSIEATLNEISKLFKEAILWDGKKGNEDKLKEKVGLFRYFYAHGYPFVRGSAATGEWFEKILYQHHGHGVKLQRSIDLEALTSRSLGAFIEDYKKIVVLTPENLTAK